MYTTKKPVNARPDKAKIGKEKLKEVHNSGDLLRTALSKHVFGQDKMITAIVAAVLADIKLCLMGKSGVGKTHAAETIQEITGLQGQILTLNPDVTCADITGFMKLDYETHKMVYYPSPFLRGNHMIILDELNRLSDKGQNALLEIINSNRVVVDGAEHKLSDIFTAIMTMNPPGDPGTRPIINAFADRIDYTLHVKSPKRETVDAILAYHFSATSRAPRNQSPSDVKFEELLSTGSMEDEIREAREIMQYLRNNHVPKEVCDTAALIQQGFQGSWRPAVQADWIPETVEWVIPATFRTAKSMVDMAMITSIIERGELPDHRHVWSVAPGCLGMLEPVGWMTTEQRLELIKMRLRELHFPSKRRATAPSKRSSNGQSSNGQSSSPPKQQRGKQHSKRKLKKELQSSNGHG